jgi:phage/plasmid-like protein (TIGR03299 family)
MENDWMFSGSDVVPWHGIGTVVQGCPTSDEALRLARLDWTVDPLPIYAQSDLVKCIPGHVANVRSDTKEVLGIVSDKYRVCQNQDAFVFLDSIVGSEEVPCTYETAGSLWNGRRVFLLVNMPEGRLVGDAYQPFICVSNSHDGSASLTVFLTAVRVVCHNTLTMALNGARRKISIRHMANMEQRKDEALRTMGAASAYFKALEDFASELAGRQVSVDQVLDKLFPVTESMSKREIENNDLVKDRILTIYKEKDDLQNFRGTAFGVLNAVADYRSNAKPLRSAPTYRERRMEWFLDGDPILLKCQDILSAA